MITEIPLEDIPLHIEMANAAIDSLNQQSVQNRASRKENTLKNFKLTTPIRKACQIFDVNVPEYDPDVNSIDAMTGAIKNEILKQNPDYDEELNIDLVSVNVFADADHGLFAGYTKHGFYHVGRVTVGGVPVLRRLEFVINKERQWDQSRELDRITSEYMYQQILLIKLKEIAESDWGDATTVRYNSETHEYEVV